jgi:hypothetical protein
VVDNVTYFLTFDSDTIFNLNIATGFVTILVAIIIIILLTSNKTFINNCGFLNVNKVRLPKKYKSYVGFPEGTLRNANRLELMEIAGQQETKSVIDSYIHIFTSKEYIKGDLISNSDVCDEFNHNKIIDTARYRCCFYGCCTDTWMEFLIVWAVVIILIMVEILLWPMATIIRCVGRMCNNEIVILQPLKLSPFKNIKEYGINLQFEKICNLFSIILFSSVILLLMMNQVMVFSYLIVKGDSINLIDNFTSRAKTTVGSSMIYQLLILLNFNAI